MDKIKVKTCWANSFSKFIFVVNSVCNNARESMGDIFV